MMYGGQISRVHAAMLREVERADRADDEAREARTIEWQNRCRVAAPAYFEGLELSRAAAAVAEARAERAAEQARQQRIDAAREHVAVLLATGQGRWRTVDEVLVSMRGWG